MLPSDPPGNFRQQRPRAIKTGIIIRAIPAVRALGCRARRGSSSARARGSPRPLQPGAPRPPLLGSQGRASRRPRFGKICAAARGSLSRGVQNLSRPGVTRGTKTISGPRARGPGPDRSDGESQGRAPSAAPCAAPFPAPRTGGLGPGGDTKKPGRPTPPAGARSDPGAPRPLTSLRRPPRTPLSPPGQSFPRPGSDPGIRPAAVPRRPRPRLGDLPSLAPAPAPPSGGSSLPTAARSLPGATGCSGPAAALTRCCPARARAGAGPGWRPAGLAPSIAP